jgi:hypothetical protein
MEVVGPKTSENRAAGGDGDEQTGSGNAVVGGIF